MENKTILKGILLTTTANTSWDSDILYFVRTNSGKTDGYLRLNGKQYGTAEDVKTLLGELPNGYATWRAFVDAVSGQTSAISEDIQTLSGLTSANTQNIETLSGLTSAHTEDIEALSGLTSAHTEDIEALSGLTSANTEDIKDLQDELDALNRDSIVEVGYSAETDTVFLIDNSGNTTTGAVLGLASKIEALSGLTSANTDNITTLSGLTSANTESIATLNGDDTTAGSVAKSIKDAIAGLDGETANTKPAQNAFVEDVTETDGVITVTYGTLPTESDITASGDELVDANATGHTVTVSATQDLQDAVANANSAVQSVNTKTGTAITINSSEIDIASDIVVSGVTAQTTSDSIQDALVDLYTKVGNGDNNLAALSAATSGIAVDVETLNGDSATTGSVDQKIATAIAGLDGETANTKPAQNAFVEDVTETDGVITVTYGTLPTETDVTATGDTLVSATATGHSVTVGATEALTSAVTNANSAVQSVNGESGTAVTIDATEIELGQAVTSGATTILPATSSITESFGDVYEKIDAVSHAAAITSTGNSIEVVSGATGNNIEVNLETGTAQTVEAGHLEIAQNASGELYGVLYYGGDDME